jgi:hypothetical protein
MDFYNLANTFSHTMTLEITQPLTEISTRDFFWGQSDNLTAICFIAKKVGSSTSQNRGGPLWSVTR